MYYPASLASAPGTISTYARNITQIGKPDLEIVVDNHEDGAVYTTFDSISGKVNIVAPQTSRFDEIRITFEGTTRTYVENISPHSTKSRTTATHNFLRLTMPIRESDYPQPRIAEAGKSYTFPFNVSFTLPLPFTCNLVLTRFTVCSSRATSTTGMHSPMLS